MLLECATTALHYFEPIEFLPKNYLDDDRFRTREISRKRAIRERYHCATLYLLTNRVSSLHCYGDDEFWNFRNKPTRVNYHCATSNATISKCSAKVKRSFRLRVKFSNVVLILLVKMSKAVSHLRHRHFFFHPMQAGLTRGHQSGHFWPFDDTQPIYKSQTT